MDVGAQKSVAKSRLSETTPTILFKRTQVKIWVNVKLPGGANREINGVSE